MELRSGSAIREALAETMAWCALQTVTAGAPGAEARRLRKLWDDANLLHGESYRKTGKPSRKAREMKEQVGDYRSLLVLSHQLRTTSLMPRIEIGESAEDSERELVVNELIAKRRALLGSESVAGTSRMQPENQGKLLAYWPAENLADGAAEYSSIGFFDQNNAPPWDTWFHFSNGRLLAWVPNVLVPLVQEGIDVNPEECIQWAEWSTLSSLET
jgi:hypothetical protein